MCTKKSVAILQASAFPRASTFFDVPTRVTSAAHARARVALVPLLEAEKEQRLRLVEALKASRS